MRDTVRTICAAACAAIGVATHPAEATTYPDRPIRLIVPTVPGTTPDVLSRLMGERLAAVLGQPLVIENRPGAIGTIGLSAVAKSLPNGYTLGVLTVPYIIAPYLLAQVPYDTERDLVPVTLIAWNYTLLTVRTSSSARSVADLVTHAKVRPGELRFSSPGNGTPPHLAGELFKRAARIELAHIPYKGAAAATAAVLTGEVDFAFLAPAPIAQYVKAGKLRTLATAAPRRLAGFLDNPTMRELGYEVEISDWQGIVVPAGTPKEVIATLHAAIMKVIAAEDFKQRLDTLGMEAGGIGLTEYAAHIRAEILRWGKLVRDAGIKAE